MVKKKRPKKRTTTASPPRKGAKARHPSKILSGVGKDAGNDPVHRFPIIGIGASAGGLKSFEEFFSCMPTTDDGMAFVVVQHLDPDHKSILTEIIRRYAHMKVIEVDDGMRVERNTTYIIPPNKDLGLMNGTLRLIKPAAPPGQRLPIDFFFKSIALEQGEFSVCIIFSGSGNDGTLGARAIKEAGGMVMVQSPESSSYDNMPRSAIETGLADFILPPHEMPSNLVGYVRHTFGRSNRKGLPPPEQTESGIQKVLVLLRMRTGHDFSHYKQSTIRRRLEKRMAVNQIDNVEGYLTFMRGQPSETDMLFREMLIGVTSFFRDPEVFKFLETQVIPRLFEGKPPGTPIRVWVPACSTGEEAYSIAILLQEQIEKQKKGFNVQVFASDIDRESIEIGRLGQYPGSVVSSCSPKRLSRFFTKEAHDFYRIRKHLRDMLVFAQQNVIKDPPFSKVDLISCRNLLIYLDATLQQKVIPLFHYALNSGGYLVLGNAETAGGGIFKTIDKKSKIYRKKEGITSLTFPLSSPLSLNIPGVGTRTREEPRSGKRSIRDLTESILLKDFAPDCIVINERSEILYIHGNAGRYLEIGAGDMNINILRTLRQGLRIDLANALNRVRSSADDVHVERLRIKMHEHNEVVDVTVRRFTLAADIPLILILFHPRVPDPKSKKGVPVPRALHAEKVASLERELRSKEEFLQSTVEELEAANEELKSTNEELQSTNEELQSTNEELETSKEELQSVNEELSTVNTELGQKIDELSHANIDMNNLLAGTGIGTVFVDTELRIQRFTPAASKVINLIPSDAGRPFAHIVSNLKDQTHLVDDVKKVLDTLIPKEIKVETNDQQRFIMRILPYRTSENIIEGVVLTFVDITERPETRSARAVSGG